MTLILAFVLGAVFCAALLLPVWLRESGRVNDLLLLLETKAAPAEVAAYLAPEQPAPDTHWIASEDGLVVFEMSDD